jgi:hypothetical protein
LPKFLLNTLKRLDSYLGCFQSPKLIRGLDALSISPFLVIDDNTNKILL